MKKILLLTISINGYEEVIKQSLESRGYKVDIYSQLSKIPRTKLNFLKRIIRSLALDLEIGFFKKIHDSMLRDFFRKEIDKLDEDYDYVFDLVAQSNLILIEELKRKYTNSKFILYLWDDFIYQKNIAKIYKEFDRVYSYNLMDCQKYNLQYRTNFFINDFLCLDEVKEYEIFYVGALRDQQRIDLVLELIKKFKNENAKLLLLGKFNLKNRIKYKRMDEIKNCLIDNPLKLNEIVFYTKKSKILLDIAYKTQVGLGLRPIESIGSKCKLITTNENIKNYDFYNENNIFVLKKDFSNLNELKVFVDKPYIDYSEEIRYKYSIDGFIDEVFN